MLPALVTFHSIVGVLHILVSCNKPTGVVVVSYYLIHNNIHMFFLLRWYIYILCYDPSYSVYAVCVVLTSHLTLLALYADWDRELWQHVLRECDGAVPEGSA